MINDANPTLSVAIDLFIEARRAARYSPHTLADYGYTYRRFRRWLGSDPPIALIGADVLTSFLASCQDVSKKTALNYHTGLSSLWQWLTEKEIVPDNPVRTIKPPKPEAREIVPFARCELLALLEAAEAGRLIERDRALILLLLDTGIRSSEICGLRMGQVSIPARRLLVYGKGDKERRIIMSERTLASIVEYTDGRRRTKSDPLIYSDYGGPLTSSGLRQTFERLGSRSGVVGAHPHRMRHTFATEFLRNGGNIYALQKILGHTTLDMVKKYLAIVQADIDSQMSRASPVERWEL